MSFICIKLLEARYPIIIIGRTISFAGSASKKAHRIYPSNPINLANGFKKLAIYPKIFKFPILIFASIHIIIPVGAAIKIDLPE